MRIVETNLQFRGVLVPRASTRRIVIHHTASGDVSAATVHQWHLGRGWAGIGYHYVVRANGTIERGRPEHVRGAHAPDANADGIGIALAGNFEVGGPTAAQLDALVWLIQDIRKRHPGIPVVGHKDVDKTACPGKNFPWPDLEKRLRAPAPQATPTSGADPAAVRLTVNGRQARVQLRVVDGRTEAFLSGCWVQLRELASLLGADIEWDERTRTVNLTVEG